MSKPTIGRTVRYVLPDGPARGAIRPAIITHVWDEDCVQLTAFPDAANDGVGAVYPASSVCLSQFLKKPGTWHWPEEVKS